MKHNYHAFIGLFYTFFIIAFICPVHAQNDTGFQLKGSLNLYLQAYDANQIEGRRPPYTWRVSGTPELTIGEWKIPVNVLVGNYQSGLRQSFNRLGISPEYKWIKMHIGHSRVSFSPLVMDRQYFLGGGVELNPGLFRFGLVYGRFRKPIQGDDSGQASPSFERKGYALKTGFGSKYNYVDVLLLKAEDDPVSIDFKDTTGGIRPRENMALGISSLQRIAKYFFLEVHGGMSILNRDLRSAKSDSLQFAGAEVIQNLIPSRNSTQLLFALQSSLEYRKDLFRLGLSYDRIDPDYSTMGIFYIQDDVQRWTLNTKWLMLQKKMNVGLRFGLENNNLKQDRFATQFRTVGLLHLNYRLNKGLSVFGNYSNFIQNAELENLAFSDSLVYEQVLNNAGAGFIYSVLRPSRINHQINFNGNYFVSTNSHPGQTGQTIRFINLQLLYTWSHLPSGWSFQLGSDMLHTNTDTENRDQLRIGPQAGFNKFLLKRKIYAGWRSYLYIDSRDGDYYSTIYRHVLSVNYRVWKKHSLRLRGYFTQTKFVNSGQADFDELQFDLDFRIVL
jgi:hypothetical protein